jgi:hypothetical protein
MGGSACDISIVAVRGRAIVSLIVAIGHLADMNGSFPMSRRARDCSGIRTRCIAPGKNTDLVQRLAEEIQKAADEYQRKMRVSSLKPGRTAKWLQNGGS